MGEAATGEAADTGTPAIEGWFTTGAEPALLASQVHDVRIGVLPTHGGLLPQSRL